MASWNLGGQALPKADLVAGDLDFFCVQEVPRDEGGWSEDRTDGFVWLMHRSTIQWRGVGVAISHDLFDCTTDRTCCSYGAAWVVRLRGSRRVVLCSLHLPTGVPVATYYSAVLECKRMLRGWHEDLPCILGVDANVELLWNHADAREHGGGVGLQSGGKVDKFLELQSGLRLNFAPPAMGHRWVPTHYPRDESRDGRHIDCILTRGLAFGEVQVDADVRLHINTDHAMLRCTVELQRTRGGRWRDSRPRWVVDPEALFEPQTWQDVKDMATSLTRPRKAWQFQDDAETKELVQEAKTSMGVVSKDMWKRVHSMRRKKRRAWKRKRILSILGGNWTAYREVKRETNQRNWWGRLLHDKSAAAVGQDVRDHLEQKIFVDDLDWKGELAEMVGAVRCFDNDFVPIQPCEVGVALASMRASAAIGPDLVGVDLLRHLHRLAPCSLARLFNEVLYDGCLPEDWGVSLLALLPKTQWPASPSELRPIAMSSAAMKTMSKVIMARTFDSIRHGCPWSSAGRGRGCADLHGAIGRVRDMSREWRLGVVAISSWTFVVPLTVSTVGLWLSSCCNMSSSRSNSASSCSYWMSTCSKGVHLVARRCVCAGTVESGRVRPNLPSCSASWWPTL